MDHPNRARPDPLARAIARDLWAAGYSARYIAARLGIGARQVERIVGRRAVDAREGRSR